MRKKTENIILLKSETDLQILTLCDGRDINSARENVIVRDNKS
jgi:hypothetical protein